MMYGGMLRLPPLAYLFADYRELGEGYSIYSASTLDFTAIYGFLFWLAAAALLLTKRGQLWRWLAALLNRLDAGHTSQSGGLLWGTLPCRRMTRYMAVGVWALATAYIALW
jgi:sulfite exporter TauE/SafE